MKIFLVQFAVAVFAKPEEAVEFAEAAFAFDNQADGIRSADGIVRYAWRKQKHLALADRDFDRLAVFLDLYLDISF